MYLFLLRCLFNYLKKYRTSETVGLKVDNI